jgi:hypothetical protein
MTGLFPDVQLGVLNLVFLLIILSLILLLIWAAWDLEQRRQRWSSYHRGKEGLRHPKPGA